jgi:hypothetical protein
VVDIERSAAIAGEERRTCHLRLIEERILEENGERG